MDRRVWFGVAALALVAALVAVLAFAGGEADATPLAYAVAWPVEQGPSTVREGDLEEGRNRSYAFQLARTNVTIVTVRLDWSDDVGRPDRFRLSVTPPNGTPKTNVSRNETVEVTFEIRSPPAVDAVEAVNRSQALDRLTQHVTVAGQGGWQVEVALEDAPGRRPVSEAPQVETEPDGSNAYNVTFGHEAFYADLGEPAPPEPEG